MTQHPDRNWRSSWTVDLKTREARHADGWIFLYECAGDAPRAWDGKCVQFPAKGNLYASQIARICREAEDIWSKAQKTPAEPVPCAVCGSYADPRDMWAGMCHECQRRLV